MRLLYASRVRPMSGSAQSYQVGNFVDKLKDFFIVEFYKLPKKKVAGAVLFFAKMIRESKKFDVIYTRDSMIAIVATLFVERTYLELHKPPRAFIHAMLRIGNVKVVSISEGLKRNLEESGLNVLSLVLPCSSNFNGAKNALEGEVCDDIYRVLKAIPKESLVFLHFGNTLSGRGLEFILDNWNFDHTFFHVGGTLLEVDFYREKYSGINAFFFESVPQSYLPTLSDFIDVLVYVIDPSWPTVPFCSPSKLADYRSFYKPVVANNPGAIEELIDNKSAYIYEFGRPESFRDAIQSVVDDLRIGQQRCDQRPVYSFELRAADFFQFTEAQ